MGLLFLTILQFDNDRVKGGKEMDIKADGECKVLREIKENFYWLEPLSQR